jgi:hypothetical protein
MTGNWIFNLDARIDEILYFIWDPIGVSDEPDARAEYLSYVPQFSYLLSNNVTKEDIVNQLLRIEQDDIGLPTNKNRAVIVADLLIGVKNAIDEKLS